MKKINLNESQLMRLMEGIENYGDNSTAERHDLGQTYITAVQDDEDGPEEPINNSIEKEVGNTQSPYWGRVSANGGQSHTF